MSMPAQRDATYEFDAIAFPLDALWP